MNRFAVVSPNPEVFAETMRITQLGLAALGHDCVEISEEIAAQTVRRIIFFGTGFVRRNAPRAGSIIYNMEQLTEARIAEMGGAALFERYTVWDYAAANLAVWHAAGLRSVHVPIGYMPEMQTIERMSHQEVDVLFYGWQSPRRAKVIEDLRNEGLNVVSFGNVFGAARDAWMARSKIVLSMHFYEDLRIVEAMRVAHCLTNRVPLVSEDGVGDEEYEGGVAFAPYDKLVETCLRYLGDEQLRLELADRGQRLMQSKPATEYFRRALNESA